MISAILLAAGESRRMGVFKQLLRLGNKSFVEHCVDNLLASRVDEVIVITGHRPADVASAIGNRSARLVHNAEYRSGMASSIKRGVESLTEGTRACVIALVDQPRVQPQIINRLIEEYEKSKPLLVIPTYEGRNGHPILVDLSLKEEILNINLAQGLREVVRRHSDRISHVAVSSGVVLEDCDLPEDYERILNK